MLLLNKESGRPSAPLLATLLFGSRADTSGSYCPPDGSPYLTNPSSQRAAVPAMRPTGLGTRRRTAPLPSRASTSTNKKTTRCIAAGCSANFPSSAPVPVCPAQETTASLRPEYIEESESPPASESRSLFVAGCVVSEYTSWRRQIPAPPARNPAPSRSEPLPAQVAPASPIPARQSLSQRLRTPSPDSLAAAKKPAPRTTNTARAKPDTT